MDEGDVLEGWKEIAAALGVTESSAKAYGSKGTQRRVRLPTYLNWRGRSCQKRAVVMAWLAGGIYERVAEESEAPTLRTGEIAQMGAP